MDVNINIGTDNKKSQESFAYPCGFCSGTGRDIPRVALTRNHQCQVCKGRGKNHFPGNKNDYTTCGKCRGRGRDGLNVNRPCRACGGKGVYKKTVS